jgi:hypothetical protein
MSVSTQAAPAKQARQRLFQIRFIIEGVIYHVLPLAADPAVALKAYRFTRRDGRGKPVSVYDLRLTPEGHAECECKGFLRWGHCKHLKTLRAAGMFPPAPTTRQAQEAQVEEQQPEQGQEAADAA